MEMTALSANVIHTYTHIHTHAHISEPVLMVVY